MVNIVPGAGNLINLCLQSVDYDRVLLQKYKTRKGKAVLTHWLLSERQFMGPLFLCSSPPGKSCSGWGLALHVLCLTQGRCIIVIWGHYLICKPCPTSDSACWDEAWGSASVISGPHDWHRCFMATRGKQSILKTSSQSLRSSQVPSIRLPGGILYSTQNITLWVQELNSLLCFASCT